MFCFLKIMRKCAAVTQRNTNSVILISEPNLILKLYVKVIMGNLPQRKKQQCSNTSISNIHTLSYLRNILARHSPDKYFLSSIHLRILMGTQEPFVPWTVFIILPLSITIYPKEGLCFAGSKQGLTCMAHHHEVNKQKNIEKEEKKGKWRKLPPIFTKNYN